MPKTTKISSLLTLIVGITLMVWLYPVASHPGRLKQLLQNWGIAGIILDLLVLSLEMLFPLVPFPLLAGINVLAFGWALGFLLALSGSMLGSSLGFWIARILAAERIRAWLSKRFHSRRSSVLGGFIPIFGARLVPVIPAASVNYLAGLSSIRFSTFFWASLLGKIPVIAWETALGGNIWQISSHPWRFLSILAGGLAIIPVFHYLFKASYKNRS